MSEPITATPAAEAARRTGRRTPPAWLITAAMSVFAVVTIVLAVTGQ